MWHYRNSPDTQKRQLSDAKTQLKLAFSCILAAIANPEAVL